MEHSVTTEFLKFAQIKRDNLLKTNKLKFVSICLICVFCVQNCIFTQPLVERGWGEALLLRIQIGTIVAGFP
jgi:hypothetical protein